MLNRILTQIPYPLQLEQKLPTRSFNVSYQLRKSNSEQQYLLKVLTTARDFEEREQELHIQQWLSAKNYSPPLKAWFSGKDYTWMLFSFELTRPFMPEQDLVRLVALLKRLHQMPIPPNVKMIKLQAKARSYLSQAYAYGSPLCPILRKLTTAIRKLRLPSQRHRPLCLCHLDLHPGNVLFTPDQLYLIDFETAGLADPLYDLAQLGFYLGFNEEELKALAYLYDSNMEHSKLDIYLSYQKLCRLIFLSYLSYRQCYRHGHLPELNPHLSKGENTFRALIKNYSLSLTLKQQEALEVDLFSAGLSLI